MCVLSQPTIILLIESIVLSRYDNKKKITWICAECHNILKFTKALQRICFAGEKFGRALKKETPRSINRRLPVYALAYAGLENI